MKYSEIWSDAKMECGINVPQLYLTPAFGMLWISQAMQKYHAAIGIIRCTDTVTLNTSSSDGKYLLPCSVGSVEEITLAADGFPQSFMQVVRLELDALHQLIETWPDQNIIPNNDWWAINQFVDTKLTYCAITGNTLVVFPYTTGGIITIRYKPLLAPYSASDTVNWAGWGTDPLAKMTLFGPPEAFIPAITGIKAYVKMEITKMRPNGLKDFAAQYLEWKQEFLEGRQFLRRHNAPYQQDTFQPSSMGGLI